jgi:galactonate dehydratase
MVAQAALRNENALADKIGHDWKNPEAYDRDDHSVVDW